ncbi:hypothetical protein [Erythrobacter sp. Dej080120_24]|uniref:hypothetical protein n=1 Tax=Erythrobacter sp. Dej080120_24 TaxID=3024837 RepID=UPI0030C6900D
MKKLLVVACASALAGCSSISGLNLPQTAGERAANYGYVPLDPLPIQTVAFAGTCRGRYFDSPEDGFLPLTQALPDVAVRFAVAEFRQGVGLQFGPSAITAKNQNYRAILDYVNSDSVTVRMLVRKYARINGAIGYYPITEPIENARGDAVLAYQAQVIPGQFDYSDPDGSFELSGFTPAQLDDAQKAALDGAGNDAAEGWQQVAFPIYVGVGFRLTADFQALKGDVALGGLGSIGANADAEKLSGSMTLQSIGVNGLGTTTALALPNKLDQTTIEQSILAIGTGRALIYTDTEESKVRLSPRVIGLYSPVGSDPRLINAVYSELSTIRLPWARPCTGD